MDIESVIDEQVGAEDLAQARSAYAAQKARGPVSERASFALAHCLIRSRPADVRQGISLLEELVQGEGRAHARDYLYYLALGHARLKQYDEALKFLQPLIVNEPENQQARELQALVQKRMQRDGLLGGIILGGGLLAGGLAAIGMGIYAAARRS